MDLRKLETDPKQEYQSNYFPALILQPVDEFRYQPEMRRETNSCKIYERLSSRFLDSCF